MSCNYRINEFAALPFKGHPYTIFRMRELVDSQIKGKAFIM